MVRSSASNRLASHAASVVPFTNGGLSDTPVAPSITHALVEVAPMASSLTKAFGDEFEMRSIILNTTFPLELLLTFFPLAEIATFGQRIEIAPKRLVRHD